MSIRKKIIKNILKNHITIDRNKKVMLLSTVTVLLFIETHNKESQNGKKGY